MRVIEDINQLIELPRRMVLSIGNFDGVHLGHQAILQAGKRAACERGTKLAVMTFDPHPVAILQPQRAPAVLTPTNQKLRLLQAAGVDVVIIVRDSFALLNLSPEDFVDQFLVQYLSPSLIVEGPNFHFGYGRSGNIQTLRQLGKPRGFGVLEVPYTEIRIAGLSAPAVCSSTQIRRFLQEGQVHAAAQMLSRPYRLMGTVVAGRGLGRQLGYPTANVHPTGQIIPAEGVYAGYAIMGRSFDEVCYGGVRHPAAISVGRAKTFAMENPLLLEAHILENTVPNLYGQWLALEFMEWLRHQQRFASQDALIDQIELDCRDAMAILL